MQFKIAGDEQGGPSFKDHLNRINVILGTNGSGKSKLLSAFELSAKSQGGFEFEVVRVTGSRRENLPRNFSTKSGIGKTFDDFGSDVKQDFKFCEKTLEELKTETQRLGFPVQSETRLQQALKHFSMSLASEKVEYRKRQYEWLASGGQTTAPDIPQDRDAEAHLDKLLSLFNEIFPEIKIKAVNVQYTEEVFIRVNQNSERVRFQLGLLKDADIVGGYSFELMCFKGNQEYPPSALSEGEKQILSLLADRFFFKGKKCLFLVDEPELNLDPVLAIKYWNLLEREMPDSVFVYTTHSLDFALRDNVERIWSLGDGRAQQIPLDKLGNLPAEEQRRFLSGIRGIITTSKGLIVEGKESSFDAKFYPWILSERDKEFQITGYDSCNDVRAATNRLDIWQEMVPAVKILGIVDADYRTQAELSKLASKRCMCLGLHDAESYLCHPDLLAELAKKLKRSNFPTREMLVEEICGFLDETKLDICHHRMAQRCSASVNVGLRKEELKEVETFKELTVKVCKSALKQASSGLEISEEYVKSILIEEYRKCLKAKSEKNITKMLNLVKGKELVDRFAKHFALPNGLELLEYVSTNLSPAAFDHTRALQQQIFDRFSTLATSAADDVTEQSSSQP